METGRRKGEMLLPELDKSIPTVSREKEGGRGCCRGIV